MTISGEERNALDVAPGATDEERESVREGVQAYLIGLALSALLTAAAFYFSQSAWIWRPSIPVALTVLAVAQIGVHLVFFLHLTTAPDNVNNTLALAFGALIVALVIGGTLWIMYHMNLNMPPMARSWRPVAATPRYETATGVIETASAEAVNAKVSGRVQSVDCEVGARVTQGQLCATIGVPSLERAVAESDAHLHAAQQRVEQDEAALNRSEAQSQRLAAAAKRRAESAKAKLDRDTHNVQEFQQALDAAKAKLADGRITAPIDSVVLSRHIEPGQSVSATSPRPLFVFAPEAVEIKVALAGEATAALKAGTRVVLAVDELKGERFDGEIIRAIQQNAGSWQVVVSAPNPRSALKPGMKATIKLPVE
ncbi:MAG: cytochrome o ubiquinol oxidase subunit IV [Methylocystis sp.]